MNGPAALYCLYLILLRAMKIKCRNLLLLVLALLLIANVSYPISRFCFYRALHYDLGVDWTVSAITGGTCAGALSMAIWLFSIKMWALSVQLISISRKQNPHDFDRLLKVFYYTILVANLLNGVLEGLKQKYFHSLLLKACSGGYQLVCFTVSCVFFADAWYKITKAVESSQNCLMNMRDFGKFVVAYGLVCVAQVTVLVSVFVRSQPANLLNETIVYELLILCISLAQVLLLAQLTDFIGKIKQLENDQELMDQYEVQASSINSSSDSEETYSNLDQLLIEEDQSTDINFKINSQ